MADRREREEITFFPNQSPRISGRDSKEDRGQFPCPYSCFAEAEFAIQVGKDAFDDEFSVASQYHVEMAEKPAGFKQLLPAVDVDVGEGPVVEPNLSSRVLPVAAAAAETGRGGTDHDESVVFQVVREQRRRLIVILQVQTTVFQVIVEMRSPPLDGVVEEMHARLRLKISFDSVQIIMEHVDVQRPLIDIDPQALRRVVARHVSSEPQSAQEAFDVLARKRNLGNGEVRGPASDEVTKFRHVPEMTQMVLEKNHPENFQQNIRMQVG